MALEISLFLVQNCHYKHCAYCPKFRNNKEACPLVKQGEIYVWIYLVVLKKTLAVGKAVLN